ncbi:hypothetical protein Tco_1191850 [Tanacetum coccineum]
MHTFFEVWFIYSEESAIRSVGTDLFAFPFELWTSLGVQRTLITMGIRLCLQLLDAHAPKISTWFLQPKWSLSSIVDSSNGTANGSSDRLYTLLRLDTRNVL